MKSILVTGASRGIGRSIAVKLADDYNDIYIHGRDEKALLETENRIKNDNNKIYKRLFDLSKPEQTVELAKSIDSEGLDVLVNNAGIAVVKDFFDVTLEDWERTINVNITAPFLLVKELYRKIPEGGSIVNILSTASKQIYSGWSSYCMSKFGADGLMRTIREELRERKIRVINIYPSATATDIWESVPGEADLSKMMSPDDIGDAVKAALDLPANSVMEDIILRVTSES